jgi:hypothetical protein
MNKKPDAQQAFEPLHESQDSIVVIVEGEEDTTERPMRHSLRKYLEGRGILPAKLPTEGKQDQG